MPSATAPESSFNHSRLRAWRDESGLRVETVADRAKVSFSYLRALEDRGGNPSAGLLARLAAVYGKPVAELFETAPAAGGDG
jgi:transcriptional regulator with XRE-family HTH domain